MPHLGILGQAMGLLGGVGALRGFPKILRVSDFTASNITGAAGFVKVGDNTVGAQQEQTWGFGAPNTAEAGRQFMDTEDAAAADVDGTIRLSVANANETAIDVVQEIRSEITSENATDITKQVSFPEIISYPVLGRRPREDDLLQVFFDFDTDSDVLSTTNSDFRIHSTLYQ